MDARSFDATDRAAEALEEAEQSVRLSGNQPFYAAQLGYALARVGDRVRALKVLDHLSKDRNSTYVFPFDLALILTGLGETDAAFEFLDAAYRDRVPRLPGHLWKKPFDRLRSDPRFKDLVGRIGFST